jgi:hypothetical protein
MIIMSHWSYARWWFIFVVALPFGLAFVTFTFWINYVLTTIAVADNTIDVGDTTK